MRGWAVRRKRYLFVGSAILAVLAASAALVVRPRPSGAAAQLPIAKLYAVEPQSNIQRLVSVDPETLQVETVLNLSGATGCQSNTIAFSPLGDLYGWNNTLRQLYKIDLETGVVTLVGSPNTTYNTNGMAFDRDGRLWGLCGATDELVSIDTTTGRITPVAPLGINIDHHGMAVDFRTNELWGASGWSPSTDYLFKIDNDLPLAFIDDFSTNTTGEYTWTSQAAGTSRQWNSAGYVQMDGYGTAWEVAHIQGERAVPNIPSSGYARIKLNITHNGTGQSRMHFFIKQDEENFYRFAGTDAVLGSSGFTEGFEKKVGGISETYTDQNTTSIHPGADGWSGDQPYVMEVWWSPTRLRMSINGVPVRDQSTTNTTQINPTAFAIKAYRFVANTDSIEIFTKPGVANIVGPLGVDTGGVAIEFSPVTGDLYAIRNTNQFMKVDTDTGRATLLGTLSGIDTVAMAAQWPRPNEAPVANAGGPYRADEGTSITFSALGSVDPDGDLLQYRWDLDNDGTWDTAWSADPLASRTWADDYAGTARLEVTDGALFDATTTAVEVDNVPPTADAGPGQTVVWGDSVQLAGSYTDPGIFDAVTGSWTFGDGGAADGMSAGHTYANPGVYAAVLTVTDDDGGSDADEALVTVGRRATRIAYAGARWAKCGDTANLSAILADDRGVPLAGAEVIFTIGSQAGTAITDASGVARLQLRIDQPIGEKGLAVRFEGDTHYEPSQTADAFVVLNANRPPSVDAGLDRLVDELTAVDLAGTASDPDGDALTCFWTQISGPQVAILGPDSLTPTFTAPEVGANTVLTFRLSVSDGAFTVSDNVYVRVIDRSSVQFNPAKSKGYWKKHPSDIAGVLGGGPIDCGDAVVATVPEAVEILAAADSKDARDMLRAQLLATLLNLRNGSNPMALGHDIRPVAAEAIVFLATHPEPVTATHPDRTACIALKDTLDAYNNSGERRGTTTATR